MSPEQVRAARGWLGWSQKELADRSQVSLSTVHEFERGLRKPIANNVTAIRRALETGGVILLFDEAGSPTGIAVKGSDHGGRLLPAR